MPEHLNETELLLLLHLLCETRQDTEDLPDEATILRQVNEADRLLEEIHKGFLHGIQEPFSKKLDQIRHGETPSPQSFNPTILREISSYTEEPGYSFQYLDMSKKRYADDSQWMSANLGFTSEQTVPVITALLGHIMFMLTMGLDSGRDPLRSFEVSSESIVCMLMGQVDAKTVGNILDFYSSPATPIEQIKGFGDFNELSAKPIVTFNGRRYLFLPNVLCKTAYESPFYAMVDSTYSKESSRHRGEFTEHFVFERLAAVIGEKNVYRNVNLWEGKNKRAEIDVMGVIADKAILIQCKSKMMTRKAQEGNTDAAHTDYEKAVGDAYKQNIECATYLQNLKINTKDSQNKPIEIPRNFSTLHPICIVADPYPALDTQIHEYAPQAHSTAGVDNLTQPIIMDIFAFDALTRMLEKRPLIFEDYLRQRSKYGIRIRSHSEINTLGFYLKGGFKYADAQIPDIIWIRSEYGLEVDAAMENRFRPWLQGNIVPEGLLSEIKTSLEPYYRFLKQISKPGSKEQLRFGTTLLSFTGPKINKFNEGTCNLCQACMKTQKVQIGKFDSSTISIYLIATPPNMDMLERLQAKKQIQENTHQGNIQRYSVLFDAQTLHICEIE